MVTRLDTKELFTVTTEANGNFCKMIKRGMYQLEVHNNAETNLIVYDPYLISFQPQIFPEEKQAGLSITPSSSTVTITNDPVKNVEFKQLLVQPEGVLKCLGMDSVMNICFIEAVIYAKKILISGPCGQKTIQIFRSEKLQEALTVNSQESTISFKFSESLPGSYVGRWLIYC